VRKNTSRDTSTDLAYKLRLPAALKAHLMDQALAHGVSLNDEIVAKLLRPDRTKRTIRQRLAELEPMASDESVSIAEVVAAMDHISPYRGKSSNGHAATASALDALDIDSEIEWLHPGGRWET